MIAKVQNFQGNKIVRKDFFWKVRKEVLDYYFCVQLRKCELTYWELKY